MEKVLFTTVESKSFLFTLVFVPVNSTSNAYNLFNFVYDNTLYYADDFDLLSIYEIFFIYYYTI